MNQTPQLFSKLSGLSLGGVGLVLAAVWGLKLAKVARCNVSYAHYWARPQGRSGGLLYVALGDSAAQSIGASRPENGYVGLLAQRLRDSTGHRVQVVNLSRSGARMDDVIDSQIPALAALESTPHVITVAIGGNDILQYDRAAFRLASDRLTSALPSGAYVADVPYFMHGHWERQARQAARMLTTSAAAHSLRPVALHEALEAQGLRAMLNQYAADWFHPNDRGHRVWADAFWQQMSAEGGDQVGLPLPVAVLQGSRSSSSRVNSGVREPRLQGE